MKSLIILPLLFISLSGCSVLGAMMLSSSPEPEQEFEMELIDKMVDSDCKIIKFETNHAKQKMRVTCDKEPLNTDFLR